jgi:hypothetical protein
MSDYSQITDFSAKDLLTTGDPNKLILGAEHDAELDAISVAITTKYDSADLASQAEAEAGTSSSKLMTPERTEQWSAVWAAENAGMVGDIQALTDPGADRILFWDDSAGAVSQLEAGDGLTISDTSLALDGTFAETDAANTFTEAQTISESSGLTELILDSAAGESLELWWREDATDRLSISYHSPSTSAYITRYGNPAHPVVSQIQFNASGIINVNDGEFRTGGYRVLNLTDIGTSVLGYDADVAYKDQANTFTETQTVKHGSGESKLIVDAVTGANSTVELRENAVAAMAITNAASLNATFFTKLDSVGTTGVGQIGMYETGDVDVAIGTFKVGGTLAGPGPCFRAYLGSATAKTGVGSTTLNTSNFSTWYEEFDTDSYYNPTTGRFTPLVAGYYHFAASWYSGDVTQDTGGHISIIKNGNASCWDETSASTVNFIGGSCGVTLYLNGSTDYVEAAIGTRSDTSYTVYNDQTQFSGHFIRGA